MAMNIDHIPVHVDRDHYYTVDEEDCRGEFDVSREAIDDATAIGLAWKVYSSELIGDVLSNPVAIFRGLNRHNFDDGYCYAGRPEKDYDDDGMEVAFTDKRLLLVFVRLLNHSLVVYDWEFREASASDIDIPDNSDIDFKERVWPTT